MADTQLCRGFPHRKYGFSGAMWKYWHAQPRPSTNQHNLDVPNPFWNTHFHITWNLSTNGKEPVAISGPWWPWWSYQILPGLFQLPKVILFFLIVIVLMFTPPSHPCLRSVGDGNGEMDQCNRLPWKIEQYNRQTCKANTGPTTSNSKMDWTAQFSSQWIDSWVMLSYQFIPNPSAPCCPYTDLSDLARCKASTTKLKSNRPSGVETTCA